MKYKIKYLFVDRYGVKLWVIFTIGLLSTLILSGGLAYLIWK